LERDEGVSERGVIFLGLGASRLRWGAPQLFTTEKGKDRRLLVEVKERTGASDILQRRG